MKHLVVGPEGHGVTVYAQQLASAVGADVIRETTFGDAHAPDKLNADSDEPIHVTFTDHLFGSSPAEAAENVLRRAAGRPFSLSLHDIPQAQEGHERFERRRPAYEKLAAAATLTVVNSHSEGAFFRGTPTTPVVIRLPIPRVDSPYQPQPGTVGVLGFIYPGKGHEDVIAALVGSDYNLRFLGGVSAGHEDWAEALTAHAEITGWLSDAELASEAGKIAVPVCAHRHYSASGSLMTWLGAGRTVLASDSPYTREIAEWLPGRITLVRPGQLRAAIDNFTPEHIDPPDYGWDRVARQWQKQWRKAGLM